MESQQASTPKPQVVQADVRCHVCSKVVPRAMIFSVYGYNCCSIKCLEPLRAQRQLAERREREARENAQSRQGAFGLEGGSRSY